MNRITVTVIGGAIGVMLIAAGLMPRPESVKRNASVAPGAPAGLSAADQQSYQAEINYLRGVSEINLNGSREIADMGAPETALAYAQKASVSAAIARCLSDERGRAVPFYEAKARCKAAEG